MKKKVLLKKKSVLTKKKAVLAKKKAVIVKHANQFRTKGGHPKRQQDPDPWFRPTHTHSFHRSSLSATVETCDCGKWRHTEHAAPAIVAQHAGRSFAELYPQVDAVTSFVGESAGRRPRW